MRKKKRKKGRKVCVFPLLPRSVLCTNKAWQTMKCVSFGLYLLMLVILACEAQELIECYECKSRGISDRCADPFQLVGRDKHMNECESGWCMKIQVGLGGEDGGGYTERKCLMDSIPDGIERCAPAYYKGQEVSACFCRGHLCNESSLTKLTPKFIWIVIFNLYFSCKQ